MNKKNIKNTKFTSEKGSTADYYDENGFHWDSYNDYLEQSDFDLIQTELLELYYLADTLIKGTEFPSMY